MGFVVFKPDAAYSSEAEAASKKRAATWNTLRFYQMPCASVRSVKRRKDGHIAGESNF